MYGVNIPKRETYGPTEDAPQVGVATMFGIELSEAEYFVRDGEHVIRSREFDVIAGGDYFWVALARFNRAVVEYGVHLGDLGDYAENEEQAFHALAPRLMRLMRERDEHRPTHWIFGLGLTRRQDDEGRPEWRPSSGGGSSQPSLA